MFEFGDTTEVDCEGPIHIGCVNNSRSRVMRLVHVSDTHMQPIKGSIPDGDILVHSGGFFNYYAGVGSFLDEVQALERFFASQPHRFKIFVAGNHEQSFVGQPIDRIRARLKNVIYLQDNSVMIEGLTFHGSPWTGKRKSPASAFVAPYPELGKYWVMIPKETDVLITHCPPHRVLDDNGIMGCPLLREIVVKQIRFVVEIMFIYQFYSPINFIYIFWAIFYQKQNQFRVLAALSISDKISILNLFLMHPQANVTSFWSLPSGFKGSREARHPHVQWCSIWA